MRRYTLLVILCTLIFVSQKSWGQPSLETFGHNRVQYQKFDWKFYQAKHFKVYFYGRSGRELGRFVAEQAERDAANIERNAGSLFPQEISIIVYNSYDDYVQTNIGLNSELQMQYNNPAGTINLIGNKLVVFYDGNHLNLQKQIRQGMAQVVMEHLTFGANFRQMARNAVLLDMPQWVTEGYVAFLVDGWTATNDNDWKNLVTQDKKLYFNDLAETHPKLAGKAFWKYISEKYQPKEINFLLFQVQNKGSINKAVKLELHQKIKTAFDSLMTFYQNRYKNEAGIFQQLDTANALATVRIPDQFTEIRNIVVSPRGHDIAYVQWKNGDYQVVIEKTHKIEGKIKRERAIILEGGVNDLAAQIDPNYPQIAWDNTGFRLGIIYKQGHFIHVKIYNAIQGKQLDYQIPPNRIDRITGFDFMQEDNEIVFTGIKGGQSDLFTLKLGRGSRVTKITDDTWDELAPVYVNGGSRHGIVFLSNRPEPYINIQPLPNELPNGPMNAFFYNLTTKSYELLQLTNERVGTIDNVIPYGQDNFAFLSDKNGVNNRYVILFGRDKNNKDSAYALPSTNFGRSIKYQNYNPASGKVADIIQYKDAFYVYFNPVEIPQINRNAGNKNPTLNLPQLDFVDKATYKDNKILQPKTKAQNIFESNWSQKPVQDKKDNFQLNANDVFQSDFPTQNSIIQGQDSVKDNQQPQHKILNQENLTPTISSSSALQNQEKTKDIPVDKNILYVDSTYLEMRPNQYYSSYTPDFLSVRLDNNLLFNRYQSYDQNGGQYQNPSLAGMLMAKVYDKMEDYRFTGGVRLPADLSGMAYYLEFENFRRRIDWGITFYRETNKLSYTFSDGSSSGTLFQEPGKTISNIAEGKLSYPLDQVRSLRFFFGGRQDRMIIRAADNQSLVMPNVQDIWGTARAEFVSDNTINPTTNIWNGLRFKFFGETFYKIYSNNTFYQINTNPAGFTKHSWVYNLGLDLRYYQKIYKDFIFAGRIAGAHSGGSQQIAYFLGGVANDLNSKFDNGMTPSGNMNYAFQSLAGDIRGYSENARNGNTYLLTNLELRFPVLTTLLHQPISSTILKNLQLVAFLDAGDAWEGILPTGANGNRPFVYGWPSNLNPPIVSVSMPTDDDNGMLLGYGLGVRTMLWGYFVRLDNAINKDGKYRWSLSFGTDF